MQKPDLTKRPTLEDLQAHLDNLENSLVQCQEAAAQYEREGNLKEAKRYRLVASQVAQGIREFRKGMKYAQEKGLV